MSSCTKLPSYGTTLHDRAAAIINAVKYPMALQTSRSKSILVAFVTFALLGAAAFLFVRQSLATHYPMRLVAWPRSTSSEFDLSITVRPTAIELAVYHVTAALRNRPLCQMKVPLLTSIGTPPVLSLQEARLRDLLSSARDLVDPPVNATDPSNDELPCVSIYQYVEPGCSEHEVQTVKDVILRVLKTCY